MQYFIKYAINSLINWFDTYFLFLASKFQVLIVCND